MTTILFLVEPNRLYDEEPQVFEEPVHNSAHDYSYQISQAIGKVSLSNKHVTLSDNAGSHLRPRRSKSQIHLRCSPLEVVEAA